MHQKFTWLILLFISIQCYSQNTFQAHIVNGETNTSLQGANVLIKGSDLGATSNQEGIVQIKNIPDGNQTLIFSYIGFERLEATYNFPLTEDNTKIVYLFPEGEQMEEVFISSTRSRRTIADLPTRVAVISGEELGEKANMKPGDIRMLLNETTGIQTQQTSATSFNSSIRIQGLDGRYTQLLKDGYPLYAGFSGGLSLLQIVPLDLKQVEVIKGASSTLYGGGAIAGLVNLVTKTPGEEEQLNLLLNGTSALGLDASAFYSNKSDKLGTTVFASYNLGSPYDPSDIGLTAIPEFDRYTLNPRFFYYPNENATLDLGVNVVLEDRTGGNIDFIESDGGVENPYFEKNETQRITTRAGYEQNFENGSSLNIKNSFSFFERKIKIPDFVFSGNQFASFNEVSYSFGDRDFEWIAGANLWVDSFDEDENPDSQQVDYEHLTYGAFLQNNWNVSELLSLETGLRLDHQNEYGTFLLPRLSAMFNFTDDLTTRVGGGLGYKTPTIFTEDAEKVQFRNVMPIDVSETDAERSYGANFDMNYRAELFNIIDFSLNSLFFYTRVDDPLILTNLTGENLIYMQPDGYLDTKGIETNVRFSYDNFKLFVGHTLADVNQHYGDETSELPLVAQNRLNNVLVYEIEDKLMLGLEGYYFGPQLLGDGATGENYWIFGLMTEVKWEKFSLFLNFENFTDTRQTRFDSIFTGSISDPQFRDIYAPVDGFVVNGGIKIKVF